MVCSIWSGARRLKPEDLVLGQGGQLPPDDVVSLGSKKLCDRTVLKPFLRLREQAGKVCAREGVRFLGGYAVADTLVDRLSDELGQLQTEFERQKQDFLAQYDRHIQEWVLAHPGFAEAIRRAVPEIQQVSQRFSFGYTVYKVMEAPKSETLNHQVNQLGNTLREEISRDAQTLFEQTFSGKQKVNRKALKPILRLRDKLNGLAFVDQGIAPVVQRLDAGLMQLPSQGSLEGEALTQLMERVLLLCSVEQMQRCAEGLSVLTEPVKQQVSGRTENPVVTPPETSQEAEVQESPVNSQPVVVPAEEMPAAATFYF
ncbi:MAG: DUF3150 domain-containing protein [Endozoicomonas sp.]